ncbi:MAG: hypothetical protein I8H93_20195 [Pseudomonadales bacterium]|nr:hypothetical protein [Pseudomonadales bacterium]MBH2078318.1 hypothetical protein [Pseudomonadales bacterium]
MVNWLEGANRARYRVRGLGFEKLESVAGKSIKRNGPKRNQFIKQLVHTLEQFEQPALSVGTAAGSDLYEDQEIAVCGSSHNGPKDFSRPITSNKMH